MPQLKSERIIPESRAIRDKKDFPQLCWYTELRSSAQSLELKQVIFTDKITPPQTINMEQALFRSFSKDLTAAICEANCYITEFSLFDLLAHNVIPWYNCASVTTPIQQKPVTVWSTIKHSDLWMASL